MLDNSKYSKFKDLPPSETIIRAQQILSTLGLDWKETIYQSTSNLYSARLNIPKLNWGTNGKGTSKDYCRASAYGEMMERIQNLHIPDSVLNSLDENTKNHLGFTFFPDEQKMALSNIFTSLPDLVEDMKQSFIESDNVVPNNKDLYQIWTHWNDDKDSFTCIPFYSVRTNDVINLPFEIIRRLCRSNGIAAGNTFDEALCQALSEIIERYALETIFTKKLTPPKIPRHYIVDNYPELYNTIMEIENKGPYTIIVYDGSLGKQMPVICVVFIDYLRQKYRIKFGCHPLFYIALERCLTELAQGCDFSQESTTKFLSTWTISEHEEWDTLKNWSSMFRSNYGKIPLSMFYSVASWKFVEWEVINNYNNKKGASLLIRKCLQFSSDVYIRNNSFLGFPSVRVYIPRMSSVYKFNPLGNQCLVEKKIINILQSFPKLANNLIEEEKEKINSLFTKDYHSIYAEKLGVSVPVLLGAINADLGRFNLAIEYLKQETNPSLYIKSAIKELEMKMLNICTEDRDNMLSLFFGAKYRTYIALNWRTSNIVGGLFDPFRLKSGHIYDKEYDNDGFNEFVSSFYIQIKEKMKSSSIDQFSISRTYSLDNILSTI